MARSSHARLKRRWLPTAAIAVFLCAAAPAAHAEAAPYAESAVTIDAASGPALATRASALADEVVARWAAVQQPDGRFPDPIYGRGGDYGTAMLGYAMLRRGAQREDRALISGGLAGLLAQVTQPQGGAFELLILARAYRWAAANLPDDPVAAPLWATTGPQLEADLARRPAPSAPGISAACYAKARCYNNIKLVTDLASIVLRTTGITPTSPTAVLADPGLRARVLHRVGSRVPKEAGTDVSRLGASPIAGAGVLSDPPRDPLAYHALSAMMLGELNDELGADAPRASRDAFGRAAAGMLALAAPDGDLSWFGRGEGQVWVSAVVADAAAQAAGKTTSPRFRGRYLALAEVSLARLRTLYGVGPLGFPLVPGALDAPTLASRTVDSYATDRGYNGLAVDALDRAAAALRRVRGTATRVPSSLPGATRSPVQAGIASITRGSLWVGLAAKSRSAADARYGSGVLAMQHEDASGTWSAIIPGRPENPRDVSTLAIQSQRNIYAASGTIVPGNSQTSVAINGGWAQPGRAATLDPGTAWTWSAPDPTTVQVSFVAKTSRVVVCNGLMGDGAVQTRTPSGFIINRPDGTSVKYSLGVANRRLTLARAQYDAGGSAYDSVVSDAQVSGRVRKGERVTLQIRVLATAPTGIGAG